MFKLISFILGAFFFFVLGISVGSGVDNTKVLLVLMIATVLIGGYAAFGNTDSGIANKTE